MERAERKMAARETRWGGAGSDGARSDGVVAMRSMLALALATCASAACDGRPAEDAADAPNQVTQSIPTSMLAEGGTSVLPPAQEFQLDELGFDYGSEDAPIKVVEFSDYGCGYCRRFHTDIFPALMEDYIDTGRVQWKYVTYVSGMFSNGMMAAFAAECAGEQERFSPMSRLLYERQADWKGLDEPYPVFEEIAVEAGADAEQFRGCVSEQRPRGRVRSGILTGARLGVRGTPSFMVNGVPVMGAQPRSYWEGLFTAIEGEVGDAAYAGDDPSAGRPSAAHSSAVPAPGSSPASTPGR